MPNQTTFEDGETTSVAATVRSLFKKNKKIIIGGGTALVFATGVFISLAKGQDVTEDFEPFPDSVAGDQKRQSPCMHEVASHQRRTKDGHTNVRSYVRGGSTA